MPAAPVANKTSGYEVGRPQGKCVVTGEAINPGDKFVAALRETETGMERLDVSLPAWEQFDKSNLLASWQTTMPAAEVKKKVFVDDEVLVQVFERLADTAEPAKINFRFVLGLILMRKRLLLYEASKTENSQTFWIIRPKGKEDRLELLDPRLNEQQIAEVSTQLSEILNSEL